MFKYKIGEEIHHRGFKKNLVVKARIEYEDFCSKELYYDCLVSHIEDCKMLDMVPEYWLDPGHRPE